MMTRRGGLEVSDNGIGIDDKHLPFITHAFTGSMVRTVAARGGTGLGLAIVKHVFAASWSNSGYCLTPGKGSIFSCRFPALTHPQYHRGKSPETPTVALLYTHRHRAVT